MPNTYPMTFKNPIPGKLRQFVLIGMGFMCVSSAALIGRTAGDALFLERFNLSSLSYMYMGTAVVVGSVAFVYGLFAGKVSITRLVCAGIGSLICGLIGLRLGLVSSWEGYRIAAYFMGDLIVHVPMMLFWNFASLLFNPREAKRLFGYIGAGGTFACIFAGLMIKPFSAQFGAENLLWIVVGLFIAFLTIVIRISHIESSRLQLAPSATGKKSPSRIGLYGSLLKSHQIRSLAWLVFAANMALTLIDYQFKAGTRLHYPAEQLAGFFGDFYAFSSIVALALQLFLVHRILQMGGVLLGLMLLPIGLFIGSIATGLTDSFFWIVATKVIVQIFLFTIDSAAIQMLYLGIPTPSRGQARAFIDGIGKPVAIAATGIGLVGIASLIPLSMLALGALGAIGVWMWFARINHKAYVTALIQSLGSKRFDLSEETSVIQDKIVSSHIKEALLEADDEEVLYLLDLTKDITNVDWRPDFRQLLVRPNPEVKIEILQYLKDHGDTSDLPAILALQKHAHSMVRTSALRAIANIDNQGAMSHLETAIDDDAPEVRAIAISMLINSGDLDHLITAGGILKMMLESPDVANRIAAAHALDNIQHAVLLRPLMALLKDENPGVRQAALQTCKKRQDPRLIPLVISLLADPTNAALSAEVLIAYGPSILDQLLPYTEPQDNQYAFDGVLFIPGILAATGTPRVLPALLKMAETHHFVMRQKALLSYCDLVEKMPSIKPFIPTLFEWARIEIDHAQTRQDQCRQLVYTPGHFLLVDALQEVCHSHIKNMGKLLKTAIPGVNLDPVFMGLQHIPENRANALEILDNVLPKAIKSPVIGFYENQTIPVHPYSTTPADVSPYLSTKESPWIISGALMMFIENQWPIPETDLAMCQKHAHAVVRETTLFAMHKQTSPEKFHDQRLIFENDPDPAVRRLANVMATDIEAF